MKEEKQKSELYRKRARNVRKVTEGQKKEESRR